MKHDMMDHDMMDHDMMDHDMMDHDMMDHDMMDHDMMDHDMMDHDMMDHDMMDHDMMDHDMMDHDMMDHDMMKHDMSGSHTMAAHQGTAKGAMIMAGTPDWLFFVSVAALLIISFIIVERLNAVLMPSLDYFKINLLGSKTLRKLIKKSWFRFLFQLPTLIIFCFIIYAGINGHAVINIAPLLTWTIWWAGLVLIVLFFGKVWCYICPWDYIASLVQFLKPFGVSSRPLTLGFKWPQGLKNIYLAIGLFMALTFFELGFKITSSPRYTAVLAIIIIFISLVPALIFERRLFCKYGCMVGRISGLYAMFSPIELRSRDKVICSRCKTKDCYNGNNKGNPCPTALTLPDVNENTYCLLCTECIKSCPNDNVAINIRPFGTDFKFFKEVRGDEAVLAVILLALTSFHGLTMTTIWDSEQNWSIIGVIKSLFGTGGLLSFAIAMAVINLSIIGIYYLFCVISRMAAGDYAISTNKVFQYYGYSLLPIALFYHLGHNAMHYFMEGQGIIPLLSDPLGQNMNIFGTARWEMKPLLSLNKVWILQVMLVLTGHICGIGIAHRISRRLYTDRSKALISLIPMIIAMILSSFLSLWIMHLDMYMRSLM